MNIIDGDCHIGTQADGFTLDADGLVAQMNHNGVDRAIVWPMAAYERDFTAENHAIHIGAERYPDRLLPFGGINPRLGIDHALRELERCAGWGFLGIKLNGARDGFAVDDPAISLPLIAHMAQIGMVLALHCGSNDFERTHPHRVAHIARLFPALPILMVHMGGVGRPDAHMHDSAISFARQHDNILLVASEAHPYAILKAIAELGAHRVCYASDAPYQPMHAMLAMNQALLRDLSTADRARVMGGNLEHLLIR
jgi:predicted TIM-barrel fold metal-dependent hydrolase